MQIVINIPEERFKDIQRIAEVQRERNHFKTAEQIIANGIPLPKGHGRLIDADKIPNDNEENLDLTWYGHILETPTIIEADKAESES